MTSEDLNPAPIPPDPAPVQINFSAQVPPGSTVRLTLEVEQPGQATTRQAFVRKITAGDSPTGPVDISQAGEAVLRRANPDWRSVFSRLRARSISLDALLLAAALAIYMLAVGIGIDRFPIYFFTDEAVHMNLAADFLRDGYRNYSGELFPTFFTLEGWVNGTSVYAQLLPFVLFGKSVVVTRLVSAFISLLGALAVALLLRDVLKQKFYWAGIFLVLTTPAWFLHARTAFEYVEVASFYAIFLYFYSRYRAGHVKSLYWAMLAGALTFYTHGLGQILMGVTGLALLVVDFRYHAAPSQRQTVLYALLLGAILLLPFTRYFLAHPGESLAQVKRRGSYWVNDNFTSLQKLEQFFRQYAYGLNPFYWYLPNKIDLNRHVMLNYGNGLLATLPLALTGFFQCIKGLRHDPARRTLLIALLACPIPASVVAIGMPRMLWMTIPLAMLSALGLSTILGLVEDRWRLAPAYSRIGLFLALAGLTLFMLHDALTNGPTWFQDYGLYGMQYGASQVFGDVVAPGLAADPSRRYVVSPSWANGTEQFTAFFIPPGDRSRISLGQPADFIDMIKKKTPDLHFVATAEEYDRLITNPAFKNIQVEQTLPFPNGKPGFYVLVLEVSDNIDQILAARDLAERTPIEDELGYNGQNWRVVHSPIGAGQLTDIFDDNPDTLARVLKANPFLIDIYPPSLFEVSSVTIQTGSLPNFTVTISLFPPGALTPTIYTQTYQGLPPDPLINIPFDRGALNCSRITIEIRDNTSGNSSQIHIRTIRFNQVAP